ncbi:ATP-binding protein [candidate division KSB1 bacterium]|nr:ATP-binding protein [candidate division KSB1 bacterium]
MRIENPYTTEYHVNPEQFAGRNDEIEAFRRALAIKSEPPSPVNIAVVGSFGIGKTSLLELVGWV